MFADERGEPLQKTVVFKYDWLPTLRRLALPKVRIHDLRHSVATLWLEAGLPLKLVQELLGHAAGGGHALAGHLALASTKQVQDPGSML